ncbi:MAG: transposase family protein, partial [Hyphomicrobiales bacterium]
MRDTLIGLGRGLAEHAQRFDDPAQMMTSRSSPRWPAASVRSRCPHCEQRCPGYDRPNRPRQWRHLDMGGMRCFVRASVSRIRCP